MAMPYREDWLAVTWFCLYSAFIRIALSSLPLRFRIARVATERMKARKADEQIERLVEERTARRKRRVYV